MKNVKKGLMILLITGALVLCSACGGARVSMSKSLYVVNETGVTLTSLTLDVEGKPLEEPIEILDGPLEAGGTLETVISLPEKQAKKGDWTVFAVTEDGAEASQPFTVGDMNPHGDNPVQGFYVRWFEEGSGGHYSAGVSFQSLEDYMYDLSEKEAEIQEQDLPDEAVGQEQSSDFAGVWESISGSFAREDSSQYDNGTLLMKYLSDGCVLFELRLMRGSESEDQAETLELSSVLAAEEDGTASYEPESENTPPFHIGFSLSEDGEQVTVTHTGELSVSPDGVYDFIASDFEVSELSAAALLEYLPTATTSLNSNNGPYSFQYPEESDGDQFFPVQAVFDDTGAVLAKFLIAGDLSAVYRADDDIEPVLIFGKDDGMEQR